MAISRESQGFAERLRRALEAVGVRASPTALANEFNLRFWGRSITPHTARNWLMGTAIPTQDKLRVLAQWLQVSPEELRFGQPAAATSGVSEPDDALSELDMAGREMLKRYLSLSVADRKLVRDVVMALALSSQARAQGRLSG